jgi:hypothetical protein
MYFRIKHQMHYIHANLLGTIFLPMAWLRRLAIGFPSQWPRYDSRSSHVRFVVDSVVFKQIFSKYFSFPYQFSCLHLPHIP